MYLNQLPFDTYRVADLNTNAEIFISGHWHFPFMEKKNNTLFLNTGCLGRTDISEKDIVPTVYIIDTESREITDYSVGEVKEGTFDEKSYLEEKEKEQKQLEFLQILRSFNKDVDEVEQLLQSMNLDKVLLDNCLERYKNIKDSI